MPRSVLIIDIGHRSSVASRQRDGCSSAPGYRLCHQPQQVRPWVRWRRFGPMLTVIDSVTLCRTSESPGVTPVTPESPGGTPRDTCSPDHNHQVSPLVTPAHQAISHFQTGPLPLCEWNATGCGGENAGDGNLEGARGLYTRARRALLPGERSPGRRPLFFLPLFLAL